ncbi:MAG TPA: hypothetical protein VMW41_06230 [Candidatus Bathyarchaeia archaeon]|nr:hypothetical protein [Candidatus Bathyarchaeia archaeon]
MNPVKIQKKLERRYPGKKIIKNNGTNPTEILCEVDPSGNHPQYSLAVSVLDRSFPHVHWKATERYKVIKGKLKIFKDGQGYLLKAGEELTINPGEVHWAEGHETWIECYSEPGWVLEDHILKEGK